MFRPRKLSVLFATYKIYRVFRLRRFLQMPLRILLLCLRCCICNVPKWDLLMPYLRPTINRLWPWLCGVSMSLINCKCPMKLLLR